MSRRATTRTAYTLVELIIVLLVISILAVVAGSRVSHSMCVQRAEGAARRIVADLEMLRARARHGSQQQNIVFDANTHCYTIASFVDPDRPGEPYHVSLADLYQAQLDTVNLGGDATLLVTGHGVADSSGTIIVRSGTEARTILIDSDTAKGEIQ